MQENLELLEYLYKDANMGTETVTTLIDSLKDKDNKIKKSVQKILKDYEAFLKKAKKLIHKYGVKVKEENAIAKMNSWMGIKMEVMKDNSDSKMADMLIKGLTMGVIDVSKKIDDFKEIASKDIIKLAQEFKEVQNNAINDLKIYL